jgi:hypothetical protein
MKPFYPADARPQSSCVSGKPFAARPHKTPNSYDLCYGISSLLDSTGRPAIFGTDASGREIFSFMPGAVPAELANHDDTTLQEVARLIRAYHDATAPLFATPSARKACIEVACHNDLSPCNTVFRDRRPVAFIDFDAAAPGSRAWDLGYAAWLWLDLGNPEHLPTSSCGVCACLWPPTGQFRARLKSSVRRWSDRPS